MLKVVKHFKKLLACLSLAFALCFVAVGPSGMVAYALEDNVGGNGSTGQGSGSFDMKDLSGKDQDLVDAFNNWDGGMSAQDFSKASQTLSPLTNILGVIVGGILALVFAGVFVITALDILYITIPPFRNILYKGAGSGSGSGAMMGRGGYGAQSMNSGMANEAKPTQWISDEAVQCAAMLSAGGAQPQQMGGYGMGGMQAAPSPEQNVSMKSVISMYFKKRMFFMVFLAVTALVLTSSILMKTGINLGAWVLKIFNTINNNIPK